MTSGSKAHKAPTKAHNALSSASPTLYRHVSLRRNSDHSANAEAPAGVRTRESTMVAPPPKVTAASDSNPASSSSFTSRLSGPVVSCKCGRISFDALRKTSTYFCRVVGDLIAREWPEARWSVLGGLIGAVLSFILGWYVKTGGI